MAVLGAVSLGLMAGAEFRGWPPDVSLVSADTRPVAAVPANENGAAAAGAPRHVAAALRPWLTGALHRNRELEAARAEDGAAITELTSKLERAEAEARQLRLELALHLGGIEALDAASVEANAAPEVEEVLGAARAGNGTQAAQALAAFLARDRRSQRDAEPLAGKVGAGYLMTAGGTARYAAASTPVNLRAAPHNASAVLAVVDKGEIVRVFERTFDSWLRVAYSDLLAREVTGWIYGRFLDPIDTPELRSKVGARPLGVITADPGPPLLPELPK